MSLDNITNLIQLVVIASPVIFPPVRRWIIRQVRGIFDNFSRDIVAAIDKLTTITGENHTAAMTEIAATNNRLDTYIREHNEEVQHRNAALGKVTSALDVTAKKLVEHASLREHRPTRRPKKS